MSDTEKDASNPLPVHGSTLPAAVSKDQMVNKDYATTVTSRKTTNPPAPLQRQLSDQRSVLLQSTDGMQFFSPNDSMEDTAPAGGDLDLESLTTLHPKLTQECSSDSLAPEEFVDETVEKTENIIPQSEGQPQTEEAKPDKKNKKEFQLSYAALNQLNKVREQKTERIVDYIELQLKDLQSTHQKQVESIMSVNEGKMSQVRKKTREIKKLTDHNNLLDSQLASLYNENVVLRERISQLEEAITRGPENAAVAAVLKDIKDKLWGDTLKISPEKRKRIVLLKKLSQTRYKPTNEKHCALLNRLWTLHCGEDTEPKWPGLGFETKNPGDEMGKTGILGLQNLVYFSERYTELAKARSRTDKYRWALAGISITALLTSLLHLHGDKGFFSAFAPPSGIFKTFTNLMNHSKAFEELYCVCFMLYDNIINTERNVNALERTKQKLQDLLLTNPHDLQELIQNAKCL